jgi:hypothetical protein
MTSRYVRAERPRGRQVEQLVLRYQDLFALSDPEVKRASITTSRYVRPERPRVRKS